MILLLDIVAAFFVALLYSSFSEWFIHKYILHGLGKNKDSYFHHHMIHHQTVLQNNYKDDGYKNMLSKASLREILGLIFALLFNIGYAFIWPMFFGWLCFFTVLYYVVHSYSHLNPEFGKKWIPWHFKHHKNPQTYFGVTSPISDHLLGTDK